MLFGKDMEITSVFLMILFIHCNNNWFSRDCQILASLVYTNFMFLLAQNYLTRGFWGDEAWTSLISQLPYKDMLKTTAADFHPPGYYSIIELLYKFFPPTEVATRSVSIIFYLLTLFMVFKLANYVRGRTFGILSAAVVATNPIFFTYAFEARNYTMFAFAACGSILFLLELSNHLRGVKTHLGGGIRLMAAFIFFTTLGIYTHYYMFFVLGAQGLYLILFDRKIFLRMIGLYAISAVLFLPWIPFLLGQLKSVAGDYWIGGIDKRTHYEALLRILGGEDKNAIRPLLFAISIILLIVGLVAHAVSRPEKDSAQHFEKPYILIWLWAIVPFILASLPGLKIDGFKLPFRPIFFWRYLIGSSIPLAMVMVHTTQKFPKYLMFVSVGLILVLSIAVDFFTLAKYPYGFKQVYANDIIGKIKPSDKIVTVLPSFAEVLYYRNRNRLTNDLIVLPEGLVQFSGKSLLDAYVANGRVKIDSAPIGTYFELTERHKVEIKEKF